MIEAFRKAKCSCGALPSEEEKERSGTWAAEIVQPVARPLKARVSVRVSEARAESLGYCSSSEVAQSCGDVFRSTVCVRLKRFRALPEGRVVRQGRNSVVSADAANLQTGLATSGSVSAQGYVVGIT